MNELSENFVEEIKSIIQKAKRNAISAVNSAMVFAYWEIGKRIVEEEQNGAEKATYGKYILTNLAAHLSRDFGKNFDARELRRIR
jgi:pantothenate kinase type III